MQLPKEFSYLEMHPELETILNTIQNTDKNMCIVGPGGGGKSEIVRLCCNKKFYNHDTIVCAPTGISAVNASSKGIHATTIHSLFRLPPLSIIPPDKLKTHDTVGTVINHAHTIIIDEISMVNSDLLTKIMMLINMYRNGRPIRLILVGDPSQLAPIVQSKEEKQYIEDMYGSRFFFDSPIFSDMEIFGLNKVFRQRDSEFVSVLNKFRMHSETRHDLRWINQRAMPIETFRKSGNFLYVALTNKTVDAINTEEMKRNPNKQKLYLGTPAYFSERDMIVPQYLYLKEGAQVMICANNAQKGYYNGQLGIVKKMHDSSVIVETDSGEVEVTEYVWNKYTYEYDTNKQEIYASRSGTYTQMPIKIAYAMTVHKTQGLTIDRMYLDLEKRTFSSGHLYTALSRVRSLDGLALARPIRHTDNKLSMVIQKFYKRSNIGEMK